MKKKDGENLFQIKHQGTIIKREGKHLASHIYGRYKRVILAGGCIHSKISTYFLSDAMFTKMVRSILDSFSFSKT